MLRLLLPVVLFVAAGASAQTPPPDLALTEVVAPGQLTQPLAVRHAGDGSGRLFIVQKNGVIRLYKNGALVATPFLTISVATSSEQGLLGLAFHPSYDGTTERRFYVSYTSTESGNPQRIAEFQTVAGDPDTADASTRREVIQVLDLAKAGDAVRVFIGSENRLFSLSGSELVQSEPDASSFPSGGLRATFELLTTASLPDTALNGYGEAMLRAAPAALPEATLLAAFESAQIPATPYALAIDPIFFTFETATGKLVRLEGRVPPKLRTERGWADLDARVEYRFVADAYR